MIVHSLALLTMLLMRDARSKARVLSSYASDLLPLHELHVSDNIKHHMMMLVKAPTRCTVQIGKWAQPGASGLEITGMDGKKSFAKDSRLR